ncbi:hypothetical protein Dimus_000588 [Dionaea muscipula]
MVSAGGLRRLALVLAVAAAMLVLSVVVCNDTAVDTEGGGKEAKEAPESWAGWAKEKIQEGLGGLKHDGSDDAAAAAGEHTKDKMEQVVSGAGGDMEEGAGDHDQIKHRVSEGSTDQEKAAADSAWEKARSTKEAAQQKAGDQAEWAKEKATTAKDAVVGAGAGAGAEAEEHLSWAKEKAKEGYDAAKRKAGETLEGAKDSISSRFDATKQQQQQISMEEMTGQDADEL